MSISTLLTAVNEYVGDTIVNDCGRPAPTRMFTYHDRLPHDCCTDDGFLVTSWANGRLFPADSPCVGLPLFTINIRYVVCWASPEVGSAGVAVTDAQDAKWNNDALMLADVAECVTRALKTLTCERLQPVDELVAAILNATNEKSLRFVGVTPIVPLGGCAGVQWQLDAASRTGPVIS